MLPDLWRWYHAAKLPGTVSGNYKDGTERTGQSGKGRSLPEGAAFLDASSDWRVIK